ncbi:DUF6443 domain-containing protein [Allomuricauda sp. F6463D]|uniref:DUF6443 domain-containing protein n=1 Tax=Allomuricauda sp. F6463D TaxID=2926409 RepID=UPI001FF254A8|nr:DUF6443 domain-containing protein [Muricauda sp. F6463D]MCK0160135.1 DUF6443 domain-containing protein [Muricauda sp. F6463D]
MSTLKRIVSNNFFGCALLLVLVFFIPNGTSAQYSLTGPSSANTGESKTYYVNGPNIATLNWSATNGANVGGQNPNSNGYPANVTFNNTGTTLVSCQIGDEFFNVYNVKKSVSVCSTVNAGNINGGGQYICYGGNPTTLGNATSASGGSGRISYQWQSATFPGSWSNITGATSSSYNPPNGLTSDRYYRRAASSCGNVAYTSYIKVDVYDELNPGIVGGESFICSGGNPKNIRLAASSSGGDGNYSYQWQYSNNGTSGWTNISSGATGSTYDPPGGLTTNRWYRKRVQSCGQTKYTGSHKVTIYPELSSGSINGGHTICYSGNPSTLGSSSLPSGGSGTYAYQWQYSDNGSSGWGDISGATSTTYNPPSGLSADRWYRREVVSCGQTKFTSSIKVTVTAPPIWYADIDGDGFGDDSETVASCTQPSGFVSNNTDSCPFEFGPSTGCDYQSVTFSDENYVYSRTYQREKSSAAQINRSSDVMEAIAYYDGLGRPMQQIAIKGSPVGKDIVTHIGYDAFGRSDKEWLPYKASNGATGTYRSSAESDTEAYYVANYASDMGSTPNPFSQKEMESSPLNRIIKQASPGEDWQLGNDHEIEFEYSTNITNEVRLFSVTTSYTNNIYEPSLIDGSGNVYYNAGELNKYITKDENHDGTLSKLHTTEEFTDKQGRVVLKRTYAPFDTNDNNNTLDPGEDEVAHDTYYVYDNFGNLTYVLPPKVKTFDGVSIAELNELSYQYKYDGKNRLVEKKIPGKGWEHIVYNKMDQPIMTQDARLSGQGKWLFTRYDALGRVAFTGMVNGGSRQAEQSAADNASLQWTEQSGSGTTVDGVSLYYNGNGYPTLGSLTELHTINYYDGYDSTRDGITQPAGQVLGQDQATDVTGLAMASKVRVLENSLWITTLTVYDKKGRAIWVQTENPYLGTTDVVKTELDFAGKPLEQQTVHTKSGIPTITTIDTFEYDHSGRLVLQKQTLDGNTETLFFNEYDALGQLVTKNVGNALSNPLQKVDYAYNVRGWLKSINDSGSLGSDIFAFGINYNQTEYGGQPLFNGNIAETDWKTGNDNVLRRYRYEYDALNRIQLAAFNIGDNSQAHRYSESDIAYDKNGNIEKLKRMGHTNSGATSFDLMDDLVYSYDSGNKLLSVSDATSVGYGFNDGNTSGNDFAYDTNGNMIMDLNKGIQANDITYNHLNLPTEIVTGLGTISYVYDAMGAKLEKSAAGSVTQYAGNYIYSGALGSENLQFFSQPEGYVTPDGQGGYDYIYQYKDHLGNVRLSYVNQSVDDQFYFETETGGWSPSGTTTLNNANQKLNISITNRWNSASKYYNITPGIPIHIEFDFEQGNMVTPTFFVRERINGVWENNADRDRIVGMEDGHYELDLTLTGEYIRVYFEKSTASDDGTTTTCYVDNFKIYQEDIEIVEENNYYPFGLEHKGYNNVVNGTEHKYKYNGKEHQEELGLNMYDYGARNYDASLGRWFGVDGLAEKYLSNSPYHYANNNPVLNYDVDGNYFVNFQSLFTAMSFQRNSRQQMDKNNKSIEQLQGLIDDGGLSEDAVANLNGLIGGLEGANSELQGSIDEVNTLMGSNQGYNIEDAGAFASSGQTTYNFNTGVVNIKAPLGNGFGLLGHEIKHAYQFDQGLTGLNDGSPTTTSKLIGVDLADEWNAYRRQNAIEPGTSYDTYNELNNDANSPYANHPRTPQSVSEHARIQIYLKLKGTKKQKNEALNKLASKNGHAFRINGKTYDGKN